MALNSALVRQRASPSIPVPIVIILVSQFAVAAGYGCRSLDVPKKPRGEAAIPGCYLDIPCNKYGGAVYLAANMVGARLELQEARACQRQAQSNVSTEPHQ